MSGLIRLSLHNNANLSGSLPTELEASLSGLMRLTVWNTQVTVPDNAAVQSWLESITFITGTQRSSGTITLDAANTASQVGLWADGETLWVADALRRPRCLPTASLNGSRAANKDIPLDAANETPQGLWADGETLWVADLYAGKLFAHTLADRQRDAAKDIPLLAGEFPRGLWGDDETLWVVDWRNNVRAYDSNGNRAAANDIPLNSTNAYPRGIVGGRARRCGWWTTSGRLAVCLHAGRWDARPRRLQGSGPGQHGPVGGLVERRPRCG